MNFHDPRTRFCNICGTSSKEARFYDRVPSRCAPCHMQKVRENRAAKSDYYRDYDAKRNKENADRRARIKAWAKTPEGKESHKRTRAKWVALNGVKRKAHIIVGNAVRDGLLIKPKECQVCGRGHRLIHGHHSDYSKPLDVVWVCPSCHIKFHK